MQNISKRIRYYRSKKGFTQEQVASALGIRTDNYAKYESGVRTPKEDRIFELAKIFDVSSFVLRDGVERLFIDLLHHYAVSSVLNDVDGFSCFMWDMENSDGAFDVVLDFYKKGVENFKRYDSVYYHKFIEKPDLASLIALYELYKKQIEESDDSNSIGNGDIEQNEMPSLDPSTTTKWAFCIAVHNYLDQNEVEYILDEAQKISGRLDPLPFFALKVFVPYLSFIIDAVEPCYLNTSIADFEISFLFDALTRPVEDDINEESTDIE